MALKIIDHGSNEYRQMVKLRDDILRKPLGLGFSQQELENYQLAPLREIVSRIAAVSGMKFFSTEVAQTATGEFVAIDYVNDQCHMVTKSSNPKIGVPDELVAAIARRLVEGAHELIVGAKRP